MCDARGELADRLHFLRLPQLIFQGQPPCHRRRHLLRVAQITVSGSLRLFKGGFGIPEQGVGVRPIVGKQRHADLGGYAQYRVIESKGMRGEGLHRLLEQAHDFPDLLDAGIRPHVAPAAHRRPRTTGA